MPGRVTVRPQAYDGPVAKNVVFAFDQEALVPHVEVAALEAVWHGDIGIHAGFPFPSLHQPRRAGNQDPAPDMVEMEMRVHQNIDLCGVPADRDEVRGDLLAGPIIELEQSGDARADT